MARGLTFLIQKVEVLYYPGSENKGADQLRGFREAELRLYMFLHIQKSGFLMTRLILLRHSLSIPYNYQGIKLLQQRTTNALVSMCGCKVKSLPFNLANAILQPRFLSANDNAQESNYAPRPHACGIVWTIVFGLANPC